MLFQQFYATARAIIFKDAKILLIKKRGVWVTPGGHIDVGESIEEALSRELNEELNVKLLTNSLYSVHDFNDKKYDCRKMELYFICEVEGEVDISNNSDGIEECRFFSLEELKNLDCYPSFIKNFDINRSLTIFSSTRDKN